MDKKMNQKIQINCTGKISVRSYDVVAGGMDIVNEIAKRVGVDGTKAFNKTFYGRISVSLEDLEEPPTVVSTFDQTPSEANSDIVSPQSSDIPKHSEVYGTDTAKAGNP